jgi:hypothetical protein
LIPLGHEGHVVAQLVQAAVPPGIERLSDNVELDAVLLALIEKVFGGRDAAALVDVRKLSAPANAIAIKTNDAGSGMAVIL